MVSGGMPLPWEELDYQSTARGDLQLRRRYYPGITEPVEEVLLNGEWLMSSLFHAAEEALAHRAIEKLGDQAGPFDVVVGGLGLGYTSAAVLEHERVGSLRVVEVFPEVIRWHHREWVPLGSRLSQDPRCMLVAGDFFAMNGGEGFDPAEPGRRFHAILLDIDHKPDWLLHPAHASFYTETGLAALQRFLRPQGVFAMWADGQPDAAFLSLLRQVFDWAETERVRFPNPMQGGESASTLYLACCAPS